MNSNTTVWDENDYCARCGTVDCTYNEAFGKVDLQDVDGELVCVSCREWEKQYKWTKVTL